MFFIAFQILKIIFFILKIKIYNIIRLIWFPLRILGIREFFKPVSNFSEVNKEFLTDVLRKELNDNDLKVKKITCSENAKFGTNDSFAFEGNFKKNY
jgi:hypothetical protein